MKNRKILAIGDIHGRNIWKSILKDGWQEHYDKVVFIGDYLDNYNQNVADIVSNFEQIVALKKTYPDKVVLLLGNHEWHYIAQNIAYSGYNSITAIQTKDILLSGIREGLFQLSYTISDTPIPLVFSHAGITTVWLEENLFPYIKKYQEVLLPDEDLFSVLDSYTDMALWNLSNIIGLCGTSSGGSHTTGSLIWARPEDLDKYGITDCLQIVGHTYCGEVTAVSKDNVNYVIVDALPVFNEDYTGYEEDLDSKKHFAVFDITKEEISIRESNTRYFFW